MGALLRCRTGDHSRLHYFGGAAAGVTWRREIFLGPQRAGAKQTDRDNHGHYGNRVNGEIAGGGVKWMEQVQQRCRRRCGRQAGDKAVRAGSSTNALRSMTIRSADSGIERPTMISRQSRSSLVSTACVPGMDQPRRQPTPLATIHMIAAGNGSSAHSRERSGRLSWNAANTASTASKAEPAIAIHMSGAAASRTANA